MDLKTGQKATKKGIYKFVKYVDAPHQSPTPTTNEKEIPLDKGDVVPPVRSSNRAAHYRWVR